MTKTLLPSVGLAHLASAVALSAAIDDTSIIIDMSEYEGALFLVPIEDCVDGGVATMALEQNDVNSTAGMVALPTAVASLTSAADDDLNGRHLAIDVYRPSGRYIQVKRTSAVANIAFGAVSVILYGARKLPVSDGFGLVSVSSPNAA